MMKSGVGIDPLKDLAEAARRAADVLLAIRDDCHTRPLVLVALYNLRLSANSLAPFAARPAPHEHRPTAARGSCGRQHNK
jgi:hypothetical protein